MPASRRVHSIDVTRGVAMILMAIDHVRVYAGVPAGGPRAGVFFTRWITNFVAPAFAFLSGTSAYFLGQRLGSKRALSKYLVTRGLILVLLELTVIRVFWTFNFNFGQYLLAGVIWMLGWCMVLLAAIIWLPTVGIAAFGIAVIFLHNAMDLLPPATTEQLSQGSLAWLWQILYFGGFIQLGQNGPTLAVLYSIFPWVGVMAAGYAFGVVLTFEAKRRDRICVDNRSIGDRSLPDAPLGRCLRRPATLASGGRIPGSNGIPLHQRHQVPGVARFPAHDARPDNSPDAAG